MTALINLEDEMEDMALKVLEEIRDLIQERIGEGMRPTPEPGATAPEGVEPPPEEGTGMETGADDEITDEDAAALSELYESEGIGAEEPAAEAPMEDMGEMDPKKKKMA